MASGVSTPGLFLTGEFLGVKREAGRSRDEADPSKGNWPDRYKLGVRTDPMTVFDVEYFTEEAAALALANAGTPERGTPITLPVYARAAKGFVFWMGAGQAAGGGEYQ
jgi:hypothetical protein